MFKYKTTNPNKQIKTSESLRSTIATAVASFTKAIETLNTVVSDSDAAFKANEDEINRLSAENTAITASRMQAVQIISNLNKLMNN